MLCKKKGKLTAGLCALAFMISALLAGCEVGPSPTPTPNPTRTFGPGVYRHAPETRAIGASLDVELSAPHVSHVAHTER